MDTWKPEKIVLCGIIGHWPLRGCCSHHLIPTYSNLGASGTADHVTLLRLFITAPAQPSATGLPCIRPCYIYSQGFSFKYYNYTFSFCDNGSGSGSGGGSGSGKRIGSRGGSGSFKNFIDGSGNGSGSGKNFLKWKRMRKRKQIKI